MSTKTIYLIRHGETEFNRMGIVQGSGVDSDLNDMGISQALAFFEAYQHLPFQKIYTSKLRRTVQSVQHFINSGISYESLEGLNEICWGEKEGKAPNYLEDEFYMDVLQRWKKGETNIPAAAGGESPEEVASRQKTAFEVILSRPEEELILVAMHGRAIRILLTHLLDLPLSSMDNFEHSNLCLYRLSYSYETQTFSLDVNNDIAHLMVLAE